MPRKEYKDRYSSVYFSTAEELSFWEEFAENHGMTLSGLIFEGLAALRDMETTNPRPDLIKENEALKDELRQVRSELKLKSELLRRYEDENYKLRFSEFNSVDPNRTPRKYDMELMRLLKSGKVLNSSDILEALNIDSTDTEATKLVWNQLASLQRYGLVAEGTRGWKWVG